MKLFKFDAKLVITVSTDGLVLKHPSISNHSARYAPMYFQMFMGWWLTH